MSPLKPRPHVCVSQGLALCLAPEAMDRQVSTVKTEVTENTTHPLSNETAPSVSTEQRRLPSAFTPAAHGSSKPLEAQARSLRLADV